MDQLWFRSALLAEGWADDVRLTLADGTITAVETGVAPAPGDERGGAALPGLPNLHSHAFQRALAGRAERRGPGGDDFWSWRTGMYRLAERIGPEDLEAIAALAYAEMLEAGFTRVGEFHYVHHDRDGAPYTEPAEMAAAIAAAADATGIGLTLLPVFYAQSGFGGLPPTPGQRRFITSPADLCAPARGQPRGGRPPAGRRRRDRAPQPARRHAREPGRGAGAGPQGPVHIHIAEQTKEVDDCLAWSGARPVQWLYDALRGRRPLVPGPRHPRRSARAQPDRQRAARSPASARSPRPTSATASFPPAPSWT